MARKHPDIYPILKSLGFPVFMQGAMPQEAHYPDLFITYIFFQSRNIWNFDNAAIATQYTCQVTVYGMNPSAIDDTVSALIERLKESGYTVDDGGRMIPSDEPTHVGWTFDCNYIVT